MAPGPREHPADPQGLQVDRELQAHGTPLSKHLAEVRGRGSLPPKSLLGPKALRGLQGQNSAEPQGGPGLKDGGGPGQCAWKRGDAQVTSARWKR